MSSNSSISFNLLDLTVDKSIDMISTTFRQVFQLIFCFVFLFFVGKLTSFLNSQFSNPQTTTTITTTQTTSSESENSELIGENNVKPKTVSPPENKIDVGDGKVDDANSGWESEQLKDDVLDRPDSPSKSTKFPSKTINKQLKRKCMSVGPVLLTPNSQLVRSLNAEDREERYTYNILPRETLITTTTDSSDRVDVCVPNVTFFYLSTCEIIS
jgi:hypothetical protein